MRVAVFLAEVFLIFAASVIFNGDAFMFWGSVIGILIAGLSVNYLWSRKTSSKSERNPMPLPKKNCPDCNYELGTHGDGLGIPDDYIPCEYCWLKNELEVYKYALSDVLDDASTTYWEDGGHPWNPEGYLEIARKVLATKGVTE